MAPKKQIQLNFLETSCTGGNIWMAEWKEGPDAGCRRKDRLEYYTEMAKIAERGKITCCFFADAYGVNDIYEGKPDATYRGSCQVAQLDPFMAVSAMAAVTKSVGFAVSANAIYMNPFILARSFSTLDHLTRGRVGWNVVTGYTNSSARAMGFDSIMPHGQRYEKAAEFTELLYQLWEGSWEDDAQQWDIDANMAYDPAKIKKIEFNGKFHKLSAAHQTHPSPQRTPVMFQAGSSKAGTAFAGTHAEGIFCGSLIPKQTAKLIREVRAASKEAGRDPTSVKAFPGVSLFIAPTLEEAQAKYDYAMTLVDPIAGLAKFSAYTNIDMSKYPLDEPFEFNGEPADNTIKGQVENFQAGDGSNEAWTPRKVGMTLASQSLFPYFVGTPTMCADFLENWVEETDVDGFSICAARFPESFEDVVDMLVPELQRRGVYWLDYLVPGGTLRENLSVVEGQRYLPDDHPAAKYRFEKEEKEEVQEEVKKEMKRKPESQLQAKKTKSMKNGIDSSVKISA